MNPALTGVRVLFGGLTENQRRDALSVLSRDLYGPRIVALPDPFSIIPSDIPLTQQAAVARGILTRCSSALAGDYDEGDFEVDQTGEYAEGDSTKSLKVHKATITIPVPEFAVIKLIRNEMGGQVPADLVGSLNGSASMSGDYPDYGDVCVGDADYYSGDYADGDIYEGDFGPAFEGGWFDKLKTVAKKAAAVAGPLVKAVTKGPLGKIAAKALKLVPGVGSVISGIEMANSLLGSTDNATASPEVASLHNEAKSERIGTNAELLAKIRAKSTKSILDNIDSLERNLDSTFSPGAVDDAIVHLLAVEGDFYDDMFAGKLVGAPSFSGDWQKTAADLINGGVDAIAAYSSKAKNAGTKAYDKMQPRIKAAWESPWGKAAAGAAGVAGAALLYTGAAKLLKNRPKSTTDRVVAKAAKAKKTAKAEELIKTLETGTPSVQSAAALSGASGSSSGLPALPSLAGLPVLGNLSLPGSPASPSDGPAAGTVTRNFIKVPFAGNSIEMLASAGNDVLDQYSKSMMTVNPAFLAGDISKKSYTDFGADFLLHGFPMSLVQCIPSAAIPLFNKEMEMGAPLTSPALTRMIIDGLLDATSGKPLQSALALRDSMEANGWKIYEPGTDVTLRDKFGNLVGDADDMSSGLTASENQKIDDQVEGYKESFMPGERTDAPYDPSTNTIQVSDGQAVSASALVQPDPFGGAVGSSSSPLPATALASSLTPEQVRAAASRIMGINSGGSSVPISPPPSMALVSKKVDIPGRRVSVSGAAGRLANWARLRNRKSPVIEQAAAKATKNVLGRVARRLAVNQASPIKAAFSTARRWLRRRKRR